MDRNTKLAVNALRNEAAVRMIQNGKDLTNLVDLKPDGAKDTLESIQMESNTRDDGEALIRKGMAMAGEKKPSQIQRLNAELSRVPTGKDVSALLGQQRLDRHENATRENDKWVNEVVFQRLEYAWQVWKSDTDGNLGTEQWALLKRRGADIILMLSDSHTMRSRPRSYLVYPINRTEENPTSFSIQVFFERIQEDKEPWATWVKRKCSGTYRQRNNFILRVPKGPQVVPFHR